VDFERAAFRHLRSMYNLARSLTRNHEDAKDIVQEASLRALRSYHRFRGGDARPWLLKIVRNTYYTWMQQNSAGRLTNFEENRVSAEQYCEEPRGERRSQW